MDVRFWGVRGSVAVSGEDFVGTGGNTTCVEVTHEGHRLVLDGGTGLQALGRQLLQEAPGLETCTGTTSRGCPSSVPPSVGATSCASLARPAFVRRFGSR